MRSALVEEVAAFGAGSRADLDEPVRRAHHGFVVFDHHHRVALFDQAAEDAHHAGQVAGVHADARFVEDEDRVREAGAEAGGQVDALDFAAGKRAGQAIEREVAEADRFEVAEACEDGLERVVGGMARVLGRQRRQHRAQVRDRRRVEFGERLALPAPEERFLAEAAAMALRAGLVGAPAGEEHPHVHLIGRPFEPAEEAADAVPHRIVGTLDVARFAVLDESTVRRRELLPRHVHRDARLATGAREVFLRFAVDRPLERRDRPFRQRQRGVRDDLMPVEADDAAEATALRARADGRVEGEERGRGRAEFPSVDRRFQHLAVAREFVALVVEQAEAGAAEAEGCEGRLMEARGLVGGDRHAVLDHQQLRRVGGDLVLRQPDTSAGGEGATEARLGEFFRDGRPAQRFRFGDRERERERLAREARQRILPGGVGSARDDHLAAGRVDEFGAMGEPDFEPVAEFGHRADRRARRADRVALLDRDGGADVLRGVERRGGQQFEELPDVRAERLDVAALPFGVQRIEDQGGFARAAEARHHDQLADRDVDVEALQVVLADAAEADRVWSGGGHRTLHRTRIAPLGKPASVLGSESRPAGWRPP